MAVSTQDPAEVPAPQEPAAATHPLDPLTAAEITTAVDAAKADRDLGHEVWFVLAILNEPPKPAVRAFDAGTATTLDREARVVILDRVDGSMAEAIVGLGDGKVRRWAEIDTPGRPPFLFEELAGAANVVKEDPRWIEAMARRGITDEEQLKLVQVDPWPAGNFDFPGEDGKRLCRCVSYVRTFDKDNGYARPIEGVVAVVDLANNTVVEVTDHGVVPIPDEPANYDEAAVGGWRTDLKPLEITQPEGPSFTVDGNQVKWQKWSFRFTLHPLEGLVLYTVGYEDGGRVRPVLYRAAISEMVVPYGDVAPAHFWKNAFDSGEFGLGRLANQLTLGCDCLGEIRYFNAVMHDGHGRPYEMQNAICMHEEDFGILWKHVDSYTGYTETRRSRRLVISSIATVGNYEYGFYWYLYQDGTLQFEVKLTGILQTAGCAPGATPPHGQMIAPGLYAPHHQHLFNMRLDVSVDGDENAVYEDHVESAPAGRDNVQGNAVVAVSTLLEREQQAKRKIDPASSRSWRVVNRSSLNRLGEPVGYRLIPGATPTLLARPESSVSKRAMFTTENLWVTPFDQDERRAAGDFVNQHPGGDGLPAWTEADRSLVDTDVVLWHTFGVTHVARPEDWPVMPVEYSGFCLKPAGFFERNPALDVPPSPAACH
jgi:primary-amine oxidase